MDNFKDFLQERKKLLAIVGGVIVLLIIIVIASITLLGGGKENTPEDTGNASVAPEKLDENDENISSETDAIKTAEEESDILTSIGVHSVYDIQNNEDILLDYTNYLNEIESLLNGLSVGFSVMDSVFSDISSMSNADALKTDFNSSVPEYQQIFELLKNVETVGNTKNLNDALLNMYVEMFSLRKSEADNLQEIGGSLIVDYSKVGKTQEEVTEYYQKVLAVHTALTDATGVYIGDGISN